MQASLRGHRIKYILMGFTGPILSTTSFDKIEALENTEKNSFQLRFLSCQSIKKQFILFASVKFCQFTLEERKTMASL